MCIEDEIAGTFRCECDEGWTGPTCDEQTESCDPNPCGNGICIVDTIDNTIICDCDLGFEFDGTTCVDIDECDPDPCLNGRCLNQFDDFFCDCNPGWSGRFCENETGFLSGVFGDPHLSTYDQFRFDCQAAGEFTMAMSLENPASKFRNASPRWPQMYVHKQAYPRESLFETKVCLLCKFL